jgi:uncharacterized protein involved in outer membrane biogenesis
VAFLDVDLALSAHGSGTDQLSAVLNKSLPDISSYHLEGKLKRYEEVLKLSGLKAEIRESNLTGDIAANTAGQQPYIRANRVSRKLYYNDFAALLAGQKNKTKTNEKRAKTQKAGKPEALPIDPQPLRAFRLRLGLLRRHPAGKRAKQKRRPRVKECF